MSMSTHIRGYKPADQKWFEMKAVWDACTKANIYIPDEVADFFNDEHPDDKPGMNVDISSAVTNKKVEGEDIYEVDLQKLPEGVQYIQFSNCW